MHNNLTVYRHLCVYYLNNYAHVRISIYSSGYFIYIKILECHICSLITFDL